MPKIVQLDPKTTGTTLSSSQVIPDAVAAVKELVENALDAGAQNIRICAKNYALDSLAVSDDGCGFDDLSLVVVRRHCTSKHPVVPQMLGFRGEALHSLATLSSRLLIFTQSSSSAIGWKAEFDSACSLVSKHPAPRDTAGTTVTVCGLFASLPVRRTLFERTTSSATSRSLARIVELLGEFALRNFGIQITFVHVITGNKNSKNVLLFQHRPCASLKQCAALLWPAAADWREFSAALKSCEISGVAARASSRLLCCCFINRRPVVWKRLQRALLNSVQMMIVLFVQVNPDQLDVNVSPDKRHFFCENEPEIVSEILEFFDRWYSETWSATKCTLGLSGVSAVNCNSTEISLGRTVSGQDLSSQNDGLQTEAADLLASSLGQILEFRQKQQDRDIQLQPPHQPLSLLKSDFARMSIVGQFNKGFIVVVLPPNLHDDGGGRKQFFIVDQHAADEIFNYETLIRQVRYRAQRIVCRILVVLSPADELLVVANLEFFESHGFCLELDEQAEPGQRCFLVSIPSVDGFDLVGGDILQDLYELVDHLRLHGRSAEQEEQMVVLSKIRTISAMKACRSSVMIGDSLCLDRMEKIVKNLSTLKNPWNCPHGRPTVQLLYTVECSSSQFSS